MVGPSEMFLQLRVLMEKRSHPRPGLNVSPIRVLLPAATNLVLETFHVGKGAGNVMTRRLVV